MIEADCPAKNWTFKISGQIIFSYNVLLQKEEKE